MKGRLRTNSRPYILSFTIQDIRTKLINTNDKDTVVMRIITALNFLHPNIMVMNISPLEKDRKRVHKVLESMPIIREMDMPRETKVISQDQNKGMTFCHEAKSRINRLKNVIPHT
jgi:hypothetical protein